MANSVIKRLVLNSSKIYRFYVNPGAVASGDTPELTSSYLKDNLFSVESGKIKSNYSGIVQIVTHVVGSSSNRLWYKVKGGNAEPQILMYGAYASGDSVQVAQISTNTEIYLEFLDAFTVGGGNTGSSYIFITILD